MMNHYINQRVNQSNMGQGQSDSVLSNDDLLFRFIMLHKLDFALRTDVILYLFSAGSQSAE